MPLQPDWLPVATPHDPAEDPPGSLDPLGTLLQAERLAEILLPGFTARMWRGRLLTIATLAAWVADHVVIRLNNRDEARLEARLAFERLVVSAIIRKAERDVAYSDAPLNLPGRELAKTALLAGEPLTRANFLKGQAVNGPFGVMARLARQLELIDVDGRPGKNAARLLSEWADDEALDGILDEKGDRAGAKWLSEAVSRTVACVDGRQWPGVGYAIWDQLAEHLRPDRIGRREKRFLLEILRLSSTRKRMVELLKLNDELFRSAWSGRKSRGEAERTVLLRGIRPNLTEDPVDRLIDAAIAATEAYEQTAALLQQTFDSLIFAIKERDGRARLQDILCDPRISRHLAKTRDGLEKIIPTIDRALRLLEKQPTVSKAQVVDPLHQIKTEVEQAKLSVEGLVDAVMRRHLRVQQLKHKASWIEPGVHWTLMPGEHRIDEGALANWQNTYLHPFKIPNAYSLLGDLGHVTRDSRYAEVQ
jgi:hypothetical protein